MTAPTQPAANVNPAGPTRAAFGVIYKGQGQALAAAQAFWSSIKFTTYGFLSVAVGFCYTDGGFESPSNFTGWASHKLWPAFLAYVIPLIRAHYAAKAQET